MSTSLSSNVTVLLFVLENIREEQRKDGKRSSCVSILNLFQRAQQCVAVSRPCLLRSNKGHKNQKAFKKREER